MKDRAQEWLRQADYDLDTAEYMLQGDRRFYAVFMAHLAVEKALKGIYQNKRNQVPPKTHNLVYLLEQLGIPAPPQQQAFLANLTAAQTATRYTEDLGMLQRAFPASRARAILDSAKETIQWVKTQL